MVCLVHDQRGIIIRREHLQPLFLTEGLDRTDGDREHAPQGGCACLFIGTVNPRDLLYLVRRLIQQLTPVCHDQHSAALFHLIFCDLGKDDGFSAPGG